MELMSKREDNCNTMVIQRSGKLNFVLWLRNVNIDFDINLDVIFYFQSNF